MKSRSFSILSQTFNLTLTNYLMQILLLLVYSEWKDSKKTKIKEKKKTEFGFCF